VKIISKTNEGARTVVIAELTEAERKLTPQALVNMADANGDPESAEVQNNFGGLVQWLNGSPVKITIYID
jgi:hypothetical protein